MKPSIEREIEAVRQALRDLTRRLENDREQLGHREKFSFGRKGEVPGPTREDIELERVLSARGEWITVATGSGGGGGAGTPDGSTLAVVTGVLNANPLSGTINARFASLTTQITVLSGTIDGHFNALSGTINNAITNLSGTINATLQAIFSSSQTWTQTANGTEGSVLSAVLPVPFTGPQYYAFITNSTGSTSPVYRIQNKNSASFQVVSTAPFQNGDKIDFLVISGGLGPVWDGSAIANLSGTIDARFFNLSGTINAAIQNLSSSIGPGGLFGAVLSAPPTSGSTGLSTWWYQYSTTSTADGTQGMYIKGPTTAGANHWSARSVAAPSSPYTITMLVAAQMPGAAALASGWFVGWAEAATGTANKGHVYLVYPHQSRQSLVQLATATSVNSITNIDLTNSNPPLMWFQLSDDGTNCTVRVSPTGDVGTFQNMTTFVKSSGYLGVSGYSYIVLGLIPGGSEGLVQLLSWAIT